MMSHVIREETMVFLFSILHGILLAFGYDVLRAFRRAFRHSIAAVSAEDFLFWMVAGLLTFCLAFFRTDGVIRGYVIAGIGLGALLYHFTASAAVVFALAFILKKIKHVAIRIAGLLSKPCKKICVFLQKRIEFARKSSYNVNKNAKKKVRGNGHGRKKKTAQQE